jgi:hypothetical protein
VSHKINSVVSDHETRGIEGEVNRPLQICKSVVTGEVNWGGWAVGGGRWAVSVGVVVPVRFVAQ